MLRFSHLVALRVCLSIIIAINSIVKYIKFTYHLGCLGLIVFDLVSFVCVVRKWFSYMYFACVFWARRIAFSHPAKCRERKKWLSCWILDSWSISYLITFRRFDKVIKRYCSFTRACNFSGITKTVVSAFPMNRMKNNKLSTDTCHGAFGW